MPAPTGVPQQTDRSPSSSKSSHPKIIRLTSYSVASMMSLVLVSAVVSPIVADESDRAVVDAPVILLTSPISGEIESIAVQSGQQIGESAPVARISNARVDRATLITLEEKAASIRESIQAARRKRDSDREYLDVLDTEISQQSAQLARQFEGQISELRAQVAESQAAGREKKALVDRQTNMVARDAASVDMLKPTTQQFEAATHRAEAQSAKLDQKIAQYEALKQGVYVGVDLAPIAELVQKRKDIALDAKRMTIEETELRASVEDREQLIDAERKRLDSLADAEIVAPSPGEVLSLEASQGRHVSAGDTLASLVDCDKTFVVAIFSYRQGQNLKVGSRVRVDGAYFERGTVAAVLPKTSDKVDERFAVPFPQTERRELYVLVEPDRSAPHGDRPPRKDALGQGVTTSCDVGQWVTVRRENGWVPSVSGVWRRMQNTATAAVTNASLSSKTSNIGSP
jgi:multidrug resistance efflux pump